jgi:peptidoglycan hydrolase-like protein with peptidoglycan-binding domain
MWRQRWSGWSNVPRLADIGAVLYAGLRRRGVLAGAVLLAVGAAFVANALFLQPRPHPAPLFAARSAPERPVPESDPLVRAVQEALARTGVYAGAIDGLAGPQTREAIESFEKAAGRATSGEASVDLLAAILSERKPAETTSAMPPTAAGDAIADIARETAAPVSDPLVASVQSALALSAYGPLNADGVVGPDTREAIMRFQRDHNLPVTGEISDGLVIELRAAGAMHDS